MMKDKNGSPGKLPKSWQERFYDYFTVRNAVYLGLGAAAVFLSYRFLKSSGRSNQRLFAHALDEGVPGKVSPFNPSNKLGQRC